MLLTTLLSKAKGHNLLAVGFKSITVSRFLEFWCLIVRAVLCDGSNLALTQ
jgi:hypothetical protein